jgi:hypothetical protein
MPATIEIAALIIVIPRHLRDRCICIRQTKLKAETLGSLYLLFISQSLPFIRPSPPRHKSVIGSSLQATSFFDLHSCRNIVENTFHLFSLQSARDIPLPGNFVEFFALQTNPVQPPSSPGRTLFVCLRHLPTHPIPRQQGSAAIDSCRPRYLLLCPDDLLRFTNCGSRPPQFGRMHLFDSGIQACESPQSL